MKNRIDEIVELRRSTRSASMNGNLHEETVNCSIEAMNDEHLICSMCKVEINFKLGCCGSQFCMKCFEWLNSNSGTEVEATKKNLNYSEIAKKTSGVFNFF